MEAYLRRQRIESGEMSEDEIAAMESRERLDDNLERASGWFKRTWLGRGIEKIKSHFNDYEVTKDIRNRGIGYATNAASNKLSHLNETGRLLGLTIVIVLLFATMGIVRKISFGIIIVFSI